MSLLIQPSISSPAWLSDHVRVLVLQLVQLFALLPQKQDSLFPKCGLNFTHSDQGAKVFQLCADLRHVQAAHVVDVLTQPCSLLLSVFSWPSLDVSDEVLIKVGSQGGSERAGGASLGLAGAAGGDMRQPGPSYVVWSRGQNLLASLLESPGILWTFLYRGLSQRELSWFT